MNSTLQDPPGSLARGTEESQVMRANLTSREIEVLQIASTGASSQEVADELYLSKRTVDFHLANIYNKLRVKNRLMAIHKASHLGIIRN